MAGGVNVDKIAVLTTYKAQVRLIHEVLKGEECKCAREEHYCIEEKCINNHTIEVCNLERIQGKEYDLIIVNTVRTVSDVPEELSLEERLDLGLLDDVSQFNTILTRARGWVLVIGDSDCLTQVGGCSNVWSKYIQACKQINGYFAIYREFDDFRMQTGNTKETKVPNFKTIKRDEIPKSKASIPLNTELPQEEEMVVDTFEKKLNHLESYIETCHHELSIATNQEVIHAVHEQLDFAKICIETMDKQRYMEQKCILSNYQAGDVPQESVSTLISEQQLSTTGYDPMLSSTPEQLFHKGPL